DALPGWSKDLASLASAGPGALPPEDLADSWIAPSWLATGQGPEVNAVMAAYRATALRDAPAMHSLGREVLALHVGLATQMREQMLVIAMAGAAGDHDFAQVAALDRKFGGALPTDDESAQVRRFLVAWAAGAH
ncbi:MAG: hypothetical protein ABI588_06440, partial [Arenimonas sp.]